MALAGAFSLSASLAQGQYTFLAFSDIKNYKQEGPQQFSFVEGSWDILVRDGQAFSVGCAGNGSPFPMFPIVPDCPLGTTALIDAGDLDGDGVRDGGTFGLSPVLFQPALLRLFARTTLVLRPDLHRSFPVHSVAQPLKMIVSFCSTITSMRHSR